MILAREKAKVKVEEEQFERDFENELGYSDDEEYDEEYENNEGTEGTEGTEGIVSSTGGMNAVCIARGDEEYWLQALRRSGWELRILGIVAAHHFLA